MRGRVYRPTWTDDDGNKRQSETWHKDYTINGQRFRGSLGTTDREEAERKLHKELADRTGASIEKRAEETTFADLCDLIRQDYRRNNRKTGGEGGRLERSIGHLEDFFAGWMAPAIDEAAVEQYVAHRLDEGYARATINRELSALKRMLRLANKQRMLMRVPDISTLKEDNARKGFFSEAELQALLEHLPVELQPLIETAYITGWRKSELLSRNWAHVDLEAGWLRLEPGESKSGEGRQFPLTDRLRGVLEAHQGMKRYLEKKHGKIIQPLFFRYDGRNETGRIKNFFKPWKRAREKAGCPERIFHDFRRTAVRNLVRAGVPEKVAMELSGHQTRSVFDRYNIVSEEMLADAGRQLDQLHTAEGG